MRQTLAITLTLLVLTVIVTRGQVQPRLTPPSAATLSSVCAIGDLQTKTGSSAGLYVCTATNTWSALPGSGGSGSPGGSDTEIQYNNAGSFGGTTGLGWDGSALSFTTSFGPITMIGGDSGAMDPALIIDDPTDGYLIVRFPHYAQFNLDSGGGVLGDFGIFGDFSVDQGGITLTANNNNYGPMVLTATYNTARTGGQDLIDINAHYANGSSDDTDARGVRIFQEFRGNANYVKSSSMYMQPDIGDTASVSLVYGGYFNPQKSGTPTIGTTYAFYSASLLGYGTHPYFLWYGDGGGNCNNDGVFRVNEYGILAYYNPCFTAYTPGAADFERLLMRWGDTGVFGTDNLAYLGVEVGGTGTNRVLNLLGSSVGVMSTPGTYTSVTASDVILSGSTQTISGSEVSAPSAPSANGFKIYAVDNGSGKTQLCAIFSSGAAQCFAQQP